jgi:hypothetical protein
MKIAPVAAAAHNHARADLAGRAGRTRGAGCGSRRPHSGHGVIPMGYPHPMHSPHRRLKSTRMSRGRFQTPAAAAPHTALSKASPSHSGRIGRRRCPWMSRGNNSRPSRKPAAQDEPAGIVWPDEVGTDCICADHSREPIADHGHPQLMTDALRSRSSTLGPQARFGTPCSNFHRAHGRRRPARFRDGAPTPTIAHTPLEGASHSGFRGARTSPSTSIDGRTPIERNSPTPLLHRPRPPAQRTSPPAPASAAALRHRGSRDHLSEWRRLRPCLIHYARQAPPRRVISLFRDRPRALAHRRAQRPRVARLPRIRCIPP